MKQLISWLIIFFTFLFSFNTAFASDNQFVTIVNPVRGNDFFKLQNATPLTNVKLQWQIVDQKHLSATWLIRPDVLQDPDLTNFFKSLPPNQELGLFIEITPTWAKTAGVIYNQTQNWHSAGSIFLTGYELSDRQKLINNAFESFKTIFGNYPKSVGAWWIDAGSLSYMKDKFGIEANMDVADQYSTDNYQVWGQFWSTPFYPSKRNALQPASGLNQKIGVVTIQWAARDPFNGYGNGVLDSTYSVQANDYANKKYHNLNIDYFKKLISIYLNNPYSNLGQVVVGMENDFSWDDYGAEFVRQIETVANLKGVRVVTMSDFASNYKKLFPEINPNQIIFANDPLNSGGQVLWFQNLKYRVGFFINSRGALIRDLRTFHDSHDEVCLSKSCQTLNMALVDTESIDEVTFGTNWIIDEGKVANVNLNKLADGVEISYLNQAGIKRKITFLPNDIKIDNQTKTVDSVISEVVSKPQNLNKFDYKFQFNLKEGLTNTLKSQILSFTLFMFFSLVFFFLPGLALIYKSDLTNNIKFILSWPLGLTIFTIASFLFGYLRIPLGVIILPLSAIFLVRKDLVIPNLRFNKQNIFLSVLILLGSLSWLATTLKNGLIYDYGLGFWGPHGHDAIWHLSLIESIKNGLPPQNSLFSGSILENYHYFYDLLLAQASYFTHISPLDLYFRFFPILVSILVGLIVVIMARSWFKSNTSSYFAVFFIYFGGSFGWVLSFFKDRSLGGETTFWAQQGVSTLINPPFAISILLFLSGLYLLHEITSRKDHFVSLLIPLVILWGTLIEFKAYAGILVLLTLFLISLWEIARKRLTFLKISLPVAILSLLVFLPNNRGGSSLIVFSPFWLIHSMIDSPDRVAWVRFTQARLAGEQTGNSLKFIISEILGLLIFIIGNLGTRIIGGLNLLRKPFNIFNSFIYVFLFLSLIIPLLFIQTGANFNTVQFFYYFLLVFNFLSAAAIAFLIKKNKSIGFIVAFLVIILTIPTTINTLSQYLPSRPPARISLSEVEALNFLRTQPQGVVLSYNYDKSLRSRYKEPVPLYTYESTAYVSAISGHTEYLADTVNLEIIGVDYKGRLQAQKDVFGFKEPEVVSKILADGQVKYIYLPKVFGIDVIEGKFNFKKIFENSEVQIFKVN